MIKKLNIIILFGLIFANVLSQNYYWLKPPFYDNLRDPQGMHERGFISTYNMSNFYIRERSYFRVPWATIDEGFKVWFSYGGEDYIIYLVSDDPSAHWELYNSGYNQYWLYQPGDRFYTIGHYPCYGNTNVILANRNYSAKIFVPPSHATGWVWEQLWSNNANGYIGPVPIYICGEPFLCGDFSSTSYSANSTGREVVFISNFLGQAFLMHLDIDLEGNVTWSEVWDNNGDDHIGDWEINEFFPNFDKYEVGDFDGDFYDEIIVYNYYNGKAMILKYDNTINGWRTIWYNNANHKIGAWNMLGPATETKYMNTGNIAQVDSDRTDELVIIENGLYGQRNVIVQHFGIRGKAVWDLLYKSINISNISGGDLWTCNIHDNYHIGYYHAEFTGFLFEELMLINAEETGLAKVLYFVTNLAGCPWIYVYNSDTTGFQPDNNILHRSEFEEYAGTDIVDKYKLNIKPDTIENNFYIQIAETESDYNYFDRIKLYAIDHPEGTKIGVTESNDIVMYDDDGVVSTDNAVQNAFNDITSYFQYNSQGRKIVNGHGGDSIYAHYDSSSQLKMFKNIRNDLDPDSMAVLSYIGRLEYTIDSAQPKIYAGEVNIYTTERSYTKKFARRENKSNVLIPFSGISDETVDSINVDLYRDYTTAYFTITPIAYSGFDVQEIPLIEAVHTVSGNVLSQLANIDMNYAELDTSGIIYLIFENIGNPQGGYVRDYIFETVGRYNVSGSAPFNKGISNNLKNLLNTPKTFKLYQNYPNPFNPITEIKFDLPKNTNVNIKVYDLLGREVAMLINEFRNAGSHNVKWNAENFASGIYIYRIEAGKYIDTKKMVLVK